MSGQFPTSPAPTTLKIGSNQPNRMSESQSGKRSTRYTGAQKFTLTASWANLTRAQFAPIDAFVLAQGGRSGVFTFQTLVYDTPLGVATGTPVVAGANQAGTTLVTSGWTPSQTGILKAGDMITIAGQTKAYKVVADANSDGSGNASLSIIPSLMTSPANAAAVAVNNILLTVSLDSDVFEYPVGKGGSGFLFNFSLAMVEVL